MGVKAYEQESDERLVALVREGETAAFGELVERYEGKLTRYGKRFLAIKEDIEDIVQDAFLSAYQNILSFDTTQRFSPWMYRIAHNAFVNKLKRNDRTGTFFFDFDAFIPHALYEDPIEKERERQELRGILDQCLDQLSSKYREVLILHYFDDMQYKDIADILQIPPGTVGIRLRRAKYALRRVYEKMNETNV